MAKKCTKNYNTRACTAIVLLIKALLGDVLVAVAVVFCVRKVIWTIYVTLKYFLQLKAAEGAQYSTDQAIKLEMEHVELKAERTVMSLRVRNVSANHKKKASILSKPVNKFCSRTSTPPPPSHFTLCIIALIPFRSFKPQSDPSNQSLSIC